MGPWSRIEILACYLSLYKNDWFLFSGSKKTKGCFELRQIQLCFQFGMDCRHNHPKARFAHSGNYKGIVPPCDPGWGVFRSCVCLIPKEVACHTLRSSEKEINWIFCWREELITIRDRSYLWPWLWLHKIDHKLPIHFVQDPQGSIHHQTFWTGPPFTRTVTSNAWWMNWTCHRIVPTSSRWRTFESKTLVFLGWTRNWVFEFKKGHLTNDPTSKETCLECFQKLKVQNFLGHKLPELEIQPRQLKRVIKLGWGMGIS